MDNDGRVFTVVLRMRPGVHDPVADGDVAACEALAEYLGLVDGLEVVAVYPDEIVADDERDGWHDPSAEPRR